MSIGLENLLKSLKDMERVEGEIIHTYTPEEEFLAERLDRFICLDQELRGAISARPDGTLFITSKLSAPPAVESMDAYRLVQGLGDIIADTVNELTQRSPWGKDLAYDVIKSNRRLP